MSAQPRGAGQESPHNAKVDPVISHVFALPSTPGSVSLSPGLPARCPHPTVLLMSLLCFIPSHQLPGAGSPQQRPAELLSRAWELHLQLLVHLFLRGGVCSDGSRAAPLRGHRELEQGCPCVCRYSRTPSSSSTAELPALLQAHPECGGGGLAGAAKSCQLSNV